MNTLSFGDINLNYFNFHAIVLKFGKIKRELKSPKLEKIIKNGLLCLNNLELK